MALYKRADSNVWQMCFFVNGKKVRRSTKTTNKKLCSKGAIIQGFKKVFW